MSKKGKPKGAIRGDMARQPMKRSGNLKNVPAKMGRQNRQPRPARTSGARGR
jgi:hypothetical protein